VLLPVTHQHPNVDWNKEKARYRGVALRQLEKLGIPDIESRIRFERMVTPADWESKVDVYRGATFNLAHSFKQMLNLRPQNRFEEFDRMYLVGGGTHPGSGLPVIFESARISCCSRIWAWPPESGPLVGVVFPQPYPPCRAGVTARDKPLLSLDGFSPLPNRPPDHIILSRAETFSAPVLTTTETAANVHRSLRP
jgi:hypothetical protein